MIIGPAQAIDLGKEKCGKSYEVMGSDVIFAIRRTAGYLAG